MSNETPTPLAVTRKINQMVSTGHSLYALASDNTLWFSDDYTKGWTALPFTPGGTIACISAGVWPGPSADIYLFVATGTALYRYDRDANGWLQVPYLT